MAYSSSGKPEANSGPFLGTALSENFANEN